MIEKGICMADGKTGAIILAAGRSAHMEELKPMLRMGQTTMIQREIDTIRQAGISPIVVVTGYQADTGFGFDRSASMDRRKNLWRRQLFLDRCECSGILTIEI